MNIENESNESTIDNNIDEEELDILDENYIDNIEQCILDITKEPITSEKLVAEVANRNNIKIQTYPAYCTARIPFIASANALVNEDKLEISFIDSMLVYQQKN